MLSPLYAQSVQYFTFGTKPNSTKMYQRCTFYNKMYILVLYVLLSFEERLAHVLWRYILALECTPWTPSGQIGYIVWLTVALVTLGIQEWIRSGVKDDRRLFTSYLHLWSMVIKALWSPWFPWVLNSVLSALHAQQTTVIFGKPGYAMGISNHLHMKHEGYYQQPRLGHARKTQMLQKWCFPNPALK